MMFVMKPLTVCTPTYNDANTIRRAIESVSDLADEIVVLDSASDDGTLDIVQEYEQTVVNQHQFRGFADLFRTAADVASNKWLLFVDADEEVRSGLRREIGSILQNPQADAYLTTKKNKMWGRWMHSEHKERPIFAKKEALRWDNSLVGEKWVVEDEYETASLEHPIHHYAYEHIDEYVEKWMRYTSAEALDEVRNGNRPSTTRYLIKGVLAFGYRYFWEKGILDGWQGLFFAIMSGVYYLVVDAKMRSLQSIQSSRDDWDEWWIEQMI